MTSKPNSGLMHNWQLLAGIASFLISVGIFYSETKGMKEKITALEGRYERQFTLINEQTKRINELEKEAAYNRGRHESKKD